LAGVVPLLPPAFLIVGAIGLDMTSPFSTIIKGAVIQEILIASIIFYVMLMFQRNKQADKAAAE
jgi:hypothetical protein